MHIEINDRNLNHPSVKLKNKKKYKQPFGLYFLVFLVSFLLFFFLNNGFTYLKSPHFVNAYTSYEVSFVSDIPEDIKKHVEEALKDVKLDDQARFKFVENSQLKLGWQEGVGLYNQYISPVSHVYGVKDDFVTNRGKIYVSKKVPESIRGLLKAKYPESQEVDDVLANLDKSGKNIALITPDELDVQMKLLTVNGKYFLDNKEGSLIYSISILSDDIFIKNIIAKQIGDLKKYEYSLDNVGTLNQTGVTAITRVLGQKTLASKDGGYPAQKISTFLKSADLTHVSNEISFVPGCTPVMGMRFCSRPEVLKTLTDSGVDIVELTGNHNNDYGASYNASTIATYEKNGMKYFGGGKDANDAKKILYVEVKGSKLAFIGYNYYDTMLGTGAIATSSHAGGNSYSESKMKQDIQEARKNADVVIVDFQFQECYSYPDGDVVFPLCYKPLSSPDQRGTFKKAIDFGADIVVGTQAHQPQTYEIYKNKVIYYGLGNLFFDQTNWVGTRHGIILTHYIKNGKVIQTKLTTTNYDSDLRTYITTGTQREFLLNLLKNGRN